MGNGPYNHIHRTDTNDGQRHGVTIYVRSSYINHLAWHKAVELLKACTP